MIVNPRLFDIAPQAFRFSEFIVKKRRPLDLVKNIFPAMLCIIYVLTEDKFIHYNFVDQYSVVEYGIADCHRSHLSARTA